MVHWDVKYCWPAILKQFLLFFEYSKDCELTKNTDFCVFRLALFALCLITQHIIDVIVDLWFGIPKMWLNIIKDIIIILAIVESLNNMWNIFLAFHFISWFLAGLVHCWILSLPFVIVTNHHQKYINNWIDYLSKLKLKKHKNIISLTNYGYGFKTKA